MKLQTDQNRIEVARQVVGALADKESKTPQEAALYQRALEMLNEYITPTANVVKGAVRRETA